MQHTPLGATAGSGLRTCHVVQESEHGRREASLREETTLCLPPIPPSPPLGEREVALRLLQGFACMLTLTEP